jgi:hypothetical protein
MSIQNPDFEFDITLQNEYIHAESRGTETPENMVYVYENIIKKVIEWDCDRVLYIEGFSNQIPIEDMFVEWRKIFSMVEQKNIKGRIAVFDRVMDDHTINIVSESLAKARGIDAKVFNNLEDAITWLKS